MSDINSDCSSLYWFKDSIDTTNACQTKKIWETSSNHPDCNNIAISNDANTNDDNNENSITLESLGEEKPEFDQFILTQSEAIEIEQNFVNETVNQILELEAKYSYHMNNLLQLRDQIIGLRELLEPDIQGVQYDTKQSIKAKLEQLTKHKQDGIKFDSNNTTTFRAGVHQNDKNSIARPETIQQQFLVFKPKLESAIDENADMINEHFPSKNVKVPDPDKLTQRPSFVPQFGQFTSHSLQYNGNGYLNISDTISDYQKQWNKFYANQFPTIAGTNHIHNQNVELQDIANSQLSHFNQMNVPDTSNRTKTKRVNFSPNIEKKTVSNQSDKYGNVELDGNLAKFIAFNNIAAQHTSLKHSLSLPVSPTKPSNNLKASHASMSQIQSPYGKYQYPLMQAVAEQRQQSMANIEQQEYLSNSQNVANFLDSKQYVAYRSTDCGSVTNFLGRSITQPVFSKQDQKWEELHGKRKVYKTVV